MYPQGCLNEKVNIQQLIWKNSFEAYFNFYTKVVYKSKH